MLVTVKPNAENAKLPQRNDAGGYLGALFAAVVGVFAGVVALRRGPTDSNDSDDEAKH